MAFNERNQKKSIKWTFDGEGLPFIDLNGYLVQRNQGNAPIKILGLYINQKAKCGPQPHLITVDYKISLPNHLLKDCEEILADPELVQLIDNGKCAFQPEQYTDKFGQTRNSGKFIDA